MSSPEIPDRPERFTPNLGLRVPGDEDKADIVTVLGELLDTTDEVLPEQVARAEQAAAVTIGSHLGVAFLHMGA